MNTIGIDNGASGTVAIMRGGECLHFGPTPTKDALHYGKKGKLTQRLDRIALRSLVEPIVAGGYSRAYVERPFTGGPMMINAMLSARGFFEATLCALEDMGIGYEVVDSGEWQKALLGAVKGSAELKKASLLRGQQIFPNWAPAIKKHGDADALLIAYHYSKNTTLSHVGTSARKQDGAATGVGSSSLARLFHHAKDQTWPPQDQAPHAPEAVGTEQPGILSAPTQEIRPHEKLQT